MKYILLLLISFDIYALEVLKTESQKNILNLNIIRVEVDSFDSYLLTNDNLIEMTLVCADNVVFDYNKTAILRYRNFYNLPVYDFKIESNEACKELGKFIETTFMAVDEERPFKIRLNIKTGKVEQIVYPEIDPFAQDGEIEDLLPKKRLFYPAKKAEEKVLEIKTSVK